VSSREYEPTIVASCAGSTPTISPSFIDLAVKTTKPTLRVACALTRPGEALMRAIPQLQRGVHTLAIAQRRMTQREGTWFDSHDHLGDHSVTDRVWTRLPDLRRLVVESGWDIFERIDHDGVEQIEIREGVPFCTLPNHARPWRVPSLRTISWHYRCDCTGTGSSARAVDFEPIWLADATALREVDLSRANLYVRQGETPLLDIPGFRRLVTRLSVLRLPHHAVARTPDELVSALRVHAARLAHLRELALTRVSGVSDSELREYVPGLIWLEPQ
jgi:hypothetical protein